MLRRILKALVRGLWTFVWTVLKVLGAAAALVLLAVPVFLFGCVWWIVAVRPSIRERDMGGRVSGIFTWLMLRDVALMNVLRRPLLLMVPFARWLATQASFICVGGSVLTLFVVWPVRDRVSAWWVCLPIGLFLAGLLLGARRWPLHDWRHRTPADPYLSPLENRFGAMPETTLVLSAHLLRSPASYVYRITHYVRPTEDDHHNRIMREIRFPAPVVQPLMAIDEGQGNTASRDVTIFVPLLYVERGVTVENLSVEGRGTSVTIVPSGRGQLLTTQLLTWLTATHFGSLPRVTRALLDEALSTMRQAVEVDPTRLVPHDALGEAKAAIRQLSGVAYDSAWDDERDAILQLWEAALTTYVTYGEVSIVPNKPFGVEVVYTKSVAWTDRGPSVETSTRTASAFRKIARATLGVRPYVHRFPLHYERGTLSYHLQFEGPEDQYVSHMRVRRLQLDDEPVPDPAHIVVARSDDTSTTNSCQVQIRPFRDVSNVGDLSVRIGMREKPPGVLGLVVLVGLVQVLMQCVVLGWYKKIFPSGHADIAVPALLLAAPAIISAWMANQISADKLSHQPLSAIAGIAYNGLAAIAGTLLAVLAAYGVEPAAWKMGHTRVAHPFWVALLLVSLLVTGNLLLRWVQGTVIFVNRLRRAPRTERFVV
jgi:hypothetical protein